MLLLSLLACGDRPADTKDTAAPLPERTFLIAPYLQSTTSQSTAILWMTDEGEESRVEWGLTEALGLTATGSAEVEGGTGVVHSVSLTGLPADTDIYYQAHTDGSASAISRMHTPPAEGEAAEFLIVAMSDMQRDDSHPDRFAEIISEGVLPYIAAEHGGEPADHVGMVLIPGDLVDSGWLFTDWVDDFFAGAAPLLAQSTLWPVPGNHEGNSPLYFRYFQLPENGTPGYEEHWWRADYGRVRVLGLDSNGAYAGDTQLSWLESELDAACSAPLDLVIAQLHHPYRSELWVSGELDFTGAVISRLEEFTEECGRPSVHLFGHTHAYSRGQSRDHRHLWVNVASAGGALDTWGSDGQVDYEEFTVSQDEYGFVVLQIDAEALSLTRVSRGSVDSPLDNVVRDTVRVPFSERPPDTPQAVEATAGASSVTLRASAFSDDGTHGASHWEVSADCADFSAPLVSRWVQSENQFGGVDLQAGDDLTDLELTGLAAGSYCWRVRYRDQGLSWSAWSEPAALVVP